MLDENGISPPLQSAPFACRLQSWSPFPLLRVSFHRLSSSPSSRPRSYPDPRFAQRRIDPLLAAEIQEMKGGWSHLRPNKAIQLFVSLWKPEGPRSQSCGCAWNWALMWYNVLIRQRSGSTKCCRDSNGRETYGSRLPNHRLSVFNCSTQPWKLLTERSLLEDCADTLGTCKSITYRAKRNSIFKLYHMGFH